MPMPPEAVPGRLMVALTPPYDEQALAGLLAGRGATLQRYLPRLGLALASVPAGEEELAAQALREAPGVAFAAPVRRSVQIAGDPVTPSDVPLDQYFSQQWGMTKVHAPEAWDVAWSDRSVAIAVIDTGVNYLHQDLRDRTWYNPGETAINPATGQRDCTGAISFNGYDDDNNGYVDDCRGWNFVDNNKNPLDGHGHGTFVAGIAAATTNNYDPIIGAYAGVAGMARQASLMELRALDDDGTGLAFDIAAAMDYAAQNGARVINLSLTLPVVNPDPYDVEALRRAVVAARTAGVVVVAATGNQGYNSIPYPAAFEGVLAVGASTPSDTWWIFSNYGNRLDLVAPGMEIVSTLKGPGNQSYGMLGSGSGTSYATPHVAGVAALVAGLRPDLGPDSVRALITGTVDDIGDPGFDPQTGWGRLNAYGAVVSATTGLSLTLTADPPSAAVNGATELHVQIVVPPDLPGRQRRAGRILDHDRRHHADAGDRGQRGVRGGPLPGPAFHRHRRDHRDAGQPSAPRP